MGWQDRNYNRASFRGDEYLSNPAAILSYSLPFGTWFGARVRLHFWLLLSFLFAAAEILRGGNLLVLLLTMAMVLAALLLHEFGHRFAARWVGGWHNEFVLWPAGGLVPPNAPPRPGATLLAHGGGIVVNLLLALLCTGLLGVLTGQVRLPMLGFLSSFGGTGWGLLNSSSLPSYLRAFLLINVGIILDNLLPFYWFDGGYLLQAILWPWLGLYRAINVTCIVGMVVAVPMLLISLSAGSFMGLIFWGLLFSSAYTRRKQLQAQGTEEMESGIAFSAAAGPEESGVSRRARWSQAAKAAKAAAQQRREQEKVDAILCKVHEKGMQSLTWWERRTLRKATERQRQRELARNPRS
ncbi:MAG: site-2 protease family protein [Bacillota bacterium]